MISISSWSKSIFTLLKFVGTSYHNNKRLRFYNLARRCFKVQGILKKMTHFCGCV
nr:MAG TPA: hypothetical protein [Caudoviricetes sp.]